MEIIISTYGFAGDLFAFILCAICIVIARSNYAIKHDNLKLFYIGIFIVAYASIASIIFHLMMMQPLLTLSAQIIFTFLLNSVLIGLLSVLALIIEYIMNLFFFGEKKKLWVRLSVWPVIVLFAIYRLYATLKHVKVFIDVNTGMVQNYSLQNSIFIYLYTYLCICALILVVHNKKFMLARIYRCLIINSITALGMVIFSYVVNNTSLMCPSFTIPIITVLFLFHYNTYDTQTGSLDLRAFKNYVSNIKADTPFAILNLHLKNDDLDNNELLSKKFILYIQEIFSNKLEYKLFRVAQNHFILVYIKNEEFETETALLDMRVQYMLNRLHSNYNISYQLLCTESQPEFTSTDYIELSNYISNFMLLNENKICSEEDINNYRKYILIKKTINELHSTNNLDSEKVIVHYQPIINKDGTCTKAEALVRLKIDNKTYYPHDIFSAIENEKCEHFLTLSILNKVCQDIKQLEFEGYDFEKISINISTEDLITNDGYRDLIDIVEKKYKMDFKKIAFEILENSDNVPYDSLHRAMTALKNVTDIEFYLDDFGDGYSNLLRLLSLPIDVVKFGKNILKSMKKNPKIFTTIKTNAQTLAEAGYEILFEGVEDEEDIQACEKINVDYCQGYAFAKPDSLNVLKEFLKKLDE